MPLAPGRPPPGALSTQQSAWNLYQLSLSLNPQIEQCIMVIIHLFLLGEENEYYLSGGESLSNYLVYPHAPGVTHRNDFYTHPAS
jgi:hypothetical protein